MKRSSPGRERAREDVKASMFSTDWCAEVAAGQDQVFIIVERRDQNSRSVSPPPVAFEASLSFHTKAINTIH